MKYSLKIMAGILAALSGLCFVSGVAVISGGDGQVWKTLR